MRRNRIIEVEQASIDMSPLIDVIFYSSYILYGVYNLY